jgi:lipopolysaccharide transport system permease protein
LETLESLTIIEPPKGLQSLNLRELWAYRELFAVLAHRDITIRYKQTVLGAAWAVLRPLLSMVVFAVVFGRFAKMPSDGHPYPVFVYAALAPWMFFSDAVGRAGGSLVGSASLVSKVYFPRLLIPMAVIGACLVDFVISALVLTLLVAYYGVPLSWNLLAVPPLVAAVSFTALGFGSALAALTVAYRDFAPLTAFLLQVWMYLTPVIYPVSLFPASVRWVLYLNPMTGLIEGFRAAFLGGPFDARALATSGLVAACVLMLGVAYFEKAERRFADII